VNDFTVNTHVPVLPQPERERWQPLRMGLVELYHYDAEEFWFRDGHLLLRGNNGTGKSKVLSLTLPFLLDANLASVRLEPDGDRGKRMDWNLLMGNRHERRVGYAWVEFGRLDDAGEVLIFTLGCGLRAVVGRTRVESWYFVTAQRPGEDLWLTTPERTALSCERLIEALGSRGQVFETAQTYRRAVDERLFRLGAERYGALIDTLIQLRQPQLSKQPDEKRLSAALTEALPPLDRATLDDVAEAMNQLDDFRRELEELDAMCKAVNAFERRYRRYAQVASRRRAAVLRRAQTLHDHTSRDLNAAEQELREVQAEVARVRMMLTELEARLIEDRARLGALKEDPVNRDANRLDRARTETDKARLDHDGAETRLAADRERLERESVGAAQRREDAALSRASLAGNQEHAARLASETGLQAVHARELSELDLPDGVANEPTGFAERMQRELRAAALARAEQVQFIRKRVREFEQARLVQRQTQETRRARADDFDAASTAVAEALQSQRQAASSLVADWRGHAGALRILRLADAEQSLANLEDWVETGAGFNPMHAALENARREQEQALAAREAELLRRRRELEAENSEREAERKRLEQGEDRTPPPPHTRAEQARTGQAGAALWQLVDFKDHVPAAERAGIEAALEAAGLLDAWVTPQGEVHDSATHDLRLIAREPVAAPSLAEWVRPTISNSGTGAAVGGETVAGILECIACCDQDAAEAEAWVSRSGEFRVGPAHGAWSKPQAQYIGHAAREAARRQRLSEISLRLDDLSAALDQLRLDLEKISTRRAAAQAEFETAPKADSLLRVQATFIAAEGNRRAAQARLGEIEARLAELQQAAARARETLEQDAADTRLPTDREGLEAVEHGLNEYRGAVDQFSNALRDHRRALFELAHQLEREAQASNDLAASQADSNDRQRASIEAQATLNTLLETVGDQVEALQRKIAQADHARRQHETELKAATQDLIEGSGTEARAAQKASGLREDLNERGEARRRAIEGLQSFAVTGLLASALPDVSLPEPGAGWGVELALTVARRAEQTLVEISAEDADWSRIQSGIGHDYTELQRAMSAQGHEASAEVADDCLLVRIVYQQRPERPDALERKLEAERSERRALLSAREREVLENHLQQEVAAQLQRLIQDTEQRVQAINEELYRRPTSTGLRYRLVWQPLNEAVDGAPTGLAEVRRRLLRTSAEAWSMEDRRAVGEFLQNRIASERIRDEQLTQLESLSRALDYRYWHRFAVQRRQDGDWKPLSGPASSGERALGLTVPLFAAASSHYHSAAPNAPRLVLLDEAFAGIDDDARAHCMALIREFDLDFVMTSEREWGCYAELPGVAICQLVRREGADAVFVSRWQWDGKTRRREDDPERRFPGLPA